MASAKSDLRGDPVGGTTSGDGTRDPESSSSDPATLRGQCEQEMRRLIIGDPLCALINDLLALVDEQAQQNRQHIRDLYVASERANKAEADLAALDTDYGNLLAESNAFEAKLAAVDASLRAQESQQKERQNDKDSRVTHLQYDSPLATAAENQSVPTKDAEWAVRNCHTLARRELRRLASWRKGGGDTTPIGMAEDTWQHVLRICERTGYVGDGPLRAEQRTWQPIETCPREVTRALLYWPTFALNEDYEQTDVRKGDGLVAESYRVGGTNWETDMVTEHYEDQEGFGYGDPTHWAPIPEPPVAEVIHLSARHEEEK